MFDDIPIESDPQKSLTNSDISSNAEQGNKIIFASQADDFEKRKKVTQIVILFSLVVLVSIIFTVVMMNRKNIFNDNSEILNQESIVKEQVPEVKTENQNSPTENIQEKAVDENIESSINATGSSTTDQTIATTSGSVVQDINLDSDQDGLIDTQELIYKTDINNPDTDGDGYSDGAEVSGGYNPLGQGKLIK